jgi:HPr kinase/phosphorylase
MVAKEQTRRGEAAMLDMYSVPLTTLVREFKLEVVYASSDYEKIQITVEDLARPGLQLAGYFDHFEPMRLQVIGNVEISYLQKLTPAERAITFDRLLSYKVPALLIARNMDPGPQCLEMARKHDVTLLKSYEATSTIVSTIISYLKAALAPRVTQHGVLMEVYGEGLLLLGESGMGKSEAAVELLKRGHRLIADDAVEIRKVSSSSLVGTAPDLIRNYVELRGIGIVNVAKLFGMGAIRTENEINLVVNIVPWNTQEVYDRLGLEEQHTEILGVKIPMYTIPITPGRNLAVILEVAAMNNRQRKMGYNPAQEFTEQIDRHYQERMEASAGGEKA